MPVGAMIANESHRLNSRLAIHGLKPGPGVYVVPRLEVELFEQDHRWLVKINRGSPMPATDVEVELWRRLNETM